MSMDDEEEERLEEIKEQYKLTDDEVLEYREAFTLFDKDEDGLVTVKDLGTVFRCLGRYPTQTEIRDLVDQVDKDGNGQIDFLEFLTVMAMEHSGHASKEDFLAVFRTIDERGHGYVTPDELRHIMRNLGERIEDEEIEDIIQEVDSDGNGQIDFEEFLQIMIPEKAK